MKFVFITILISGSIAVGSQSVCASPKVPLRDYLGKVFHTLKKIPVNLAQDIDKLSNTGKVFGVLILSASVMNFIGAEVFRDRNEVLVRDRNKAIQMLVREIPVGVELIEDIAVEDIVNEERDVAEETRIVVVMGADSAFAAFIVKVQVAGHESMHLLDMSDFADGKFNFVMGYGENGFLTTVEVPIPETEESIELFLVHNDDNELRLIHEGTSYYLVARTEGIVGGR